MQVREATHRHNSALCIQQILGVPHCPRDFQTSNIEEIYGGQGYRLMWSGNQEGSGDAVLLGAHRRVSDEPGEAHCDFRKHLEQRNTIKLHVGNKVHQR